MISSLTKRGLKPHRKLIDGLSKVSGWFLATRLLQIACSVWVTRVLSPSDFGVIAAVFAIQGLANQLTTLPMSSALVRSKTINDADIAAAWTWEMTRFAILFLAILAIGPSVAEWMDKPEAAGVIRISALSLVFNGMRSPRLVEIRREGRFGLIGFFDAFPSAVYSLVSVLSVVWIPSYWALVIANLSASLMTAIVTHAILPWRPRVNFNLKVAAPMFSFGIVLSGMTMLTALRTHGAVFIISAFGSAAVLGYYNRAMAFSWALGMQLTSLFWRVAYPLFSKDTRAGSDSLAGALQLQWQLLTVGVPLSLLASFAGRPLVLLILGDRWEPILSLWSLLVCAIAIALSNAPLEVAFQSSHHERTALGIYAVMTCAQLALIFLLFPPLGIAGVGIAFVSAQVINAIGFRLVGTRLRSSEVMREKAQS